MLDFLKKIRSSVYDPDFYRGLIDTSVWSAVRYYLWIAFFIAVILSLSTTAFLGPRLLTFVDESEDVARGLYPAELVVTVKSGTAASNVAEPYRVPMPKELDELFATREYFTGNKIRAPTNFAVINTNKEANIKEFYQMDTFILVAKDGLMVDQDVGTKPKVQFDEYGTDIVMTHTLYQSILDGVYRLRQYLPVAILAVFFGGFFLWGVLHFVYFIFAGLLIYLLLRARSLSATFGNSYKIAIHASTLPILANFILTFATMNPATLARVPFLFTIILLLVVWVNTRGIESPAVTEKAEV